MSLSVEFSRIGFIIGAGAHVPYGMPVSAELTEQIKNLNYPRLKISSVEHTGDQDERINQKKHICRIIRDLGLIPKPEKAQARNAHDLLLAKQLDYFLDTFAGSQVYSIDAFLAKYISEHKKEGDDLLIQIGKVVLIYFIARNENKIPIGYHKFDWIQLLINNYLKDRNSRERFFTSPPQIATFNYDRLFERSIMYHLKHFHGLDDVEAKDFVTKLNIKHIYGDLGPFEQTFNIDDISHIKEAMKRIKVIGEERLPNIENISKEIFNSMKDLKKVYLLGYGFDFQNNELLFSKFKKNARTNRYRSRELNIPMFVSTNIKLSEEACRRIKSDMQEIHVDLHDYDKHVGKVDSMDLFQTLHPIEQAMEDYSAKFYQTADESDLDDDY